MNWCIIVGLTVLTVIAVSLPASSDKLDSYIKTEMKKDHIPGISIGVIRNGKPVAVRSYGVSDIERSVKANKDTVYPLGSLTKQFTATAVMMLVEEGKVRLDERICEYIPNLPASWKEVTVRELLTHTSGIKNITTIPELIKYPACTYSPDQVIKVMSSYPLDFASGTDMRYSNSGYYILGLLIERMTGQSYESILKKRIFEPLGMSATRFVSSTDIIPNRACCYQLENDHLVNFVEIKGIYPYAAGGLMSSVSDLAKWEKALCECKLLKRESYDQMWTPATLNGGKQAPRNLGFGWAIDNYQGGSLLKHAGNGAGGSAYIGRYVGSGLTIIVLTNLNYGPESQLGTGIAEILLNEPSEAINQRNLGR